MSVSNLRGYNILPLDVPLQISAREEEFFKLVTKIEDWEELKAHITKVQVEAYESIYSYPCIRSFNFCRFKVSTPSYSSSFVRELIAFCFNKRLLPISLILKFDNLVNRMIQASSSIWDVALVQMFVR